MTQPVLLITLVVSVVIYTQGEPAVAQQAASPSPKGTACAALPPVCTKNPGAADHQHDNDGDCLANDEESQYGTDPENTDTDCDGLSDYDEIYVYGTAPTNRDSDQDSAGPDGKGVPNANLYDGNELKSAPKRPSSPLLKDTDGDGMTDYEELQEQFNPAVAEVPVFTVDIEDSPTVQIWTTESDKASVQVAINTSQQEKKSDQNVVQNTIKNETNLNAKVGLDLTKITSPSITKFDLEGGWTRTDSFSNTTTLQLEESSKEDFNRAYNQNRDVEFKKATLTGRMKFVNNGRFAVDLQNVEISFFRFDPQTGETQVIASASTPKDGAVTVGTGDSNFIYITFADTEISIPMAQALLENPYGLGLQVDSFEPIQPQAGNQNFKAITENVVSYANTLIIDYGVERDIEKFSVANHIYRTTKGEASPCTPDATRAGQSCLFGVTMKQVLGDYLDIDYETFDTGALKRVRDVDTQLTAAGKIKGYWAVSKNNISARDQNKFEEITFRPPEGADVTNRDVISLVYVKDEDGDGLIDREELAYGTDYQKADTDGDGLSDRDELREGWMLALAKEKVFSDPLAADSDGDLLNDSREKQAQTDPYKSDTDGDTLGDSEEVTKYRTNPNNSDSDADKLTDGEEIAGVEVKDKAYTSDPLKQDTDGDQLDDYTEDKTYFTNPNSQDTDGDTVSDYVEVTTAYGPYLNQYGNKTDPNNKDTDADGFDDAQDQYPLVPSNDVYLVNTGELCAQQPLNPTSWNVEFAACYVNPFLFSLQSRDSNKDGKILIKNSSQGFCLQADSKNWIVQGDCASGLSFIVEKWENTDSFKIYRPTNPPLCLDQDTFYDELELSTCSHTEESQKFTLKRK
jgi:hypothetical protein